MTHVSASTALTGLATVFFSVSLLVPLIEGHVRRDYHHHDHEHTSGEEDDHSTRFIDLTHAFNNNTPVWPGRKITFYTEFEGRTENGIWVASNGFCTSEHTSTHIDAPYHFNENGRRLHDIPFEDLIEVPGIMLDIYDKVHRLEDGELTVVENYGLTREDVMEWEEKNGKIPQGAVVLLRTGWGKRWGDPRLFRGEKVNPSAASTPPPAQAPSDEDNKLVENSNASGASKQFYDTSQSGVAAKLSFPGFGESAAKFLSVERAVRGVGVDVISIDPGNQNILSPAHVLFASRNIYMLEMVANLHQLPPRGFDLWIMPFKIDFGTGAPTRVIARIAEK